MHKLSEQLTGLRNYFDGIIPCNNGGDIYIGVVLAHNCNFKNIELHIQYWY